MKKPLRNVGASVRDRLPKLARANGQPNGELLDRYCIERLPYRLPRSEHRSRFILKGAMLLTAWSGGVTQWVTPDADLLGFGDRSLPALSQAFREICATVVEADGVRFEFDSIQGEHTRAHEEYVGLRIELRAILGGAVVRVQVDIGTGDAVRPTEIVLPTLLDFPQPFLRAYTRENSLAEEFQAMVKLGFINTRMKDYFRMTVKSTTPFESRPGFKADFFSNVTTRRSGFEIASLDRAVETVFYCPIENLKKCPAGIVVFRYAIFSQLNSVSTYCVGGTVCGVDSPSSFCRR